MLLRIVPLAPQSRFGDVGYTENVYSTEIFIMVTRVSYMRKAHFGTSMKGFLSATVHENLSK